jgi:soluble lytic murein transglycosylase
MLRLVSRRAPVLPAAIGRALVLGATAFACAGFVPGARAQSGDEAVIASREAFGRKDRARLVLLRDRLAATGHPLAPWADYWELTSRVQEAPAADFEAFWQRWPGTYVEDRLRNDWLLELGRRRDFASFAREHPRFRMQDDREVACYALLVRHQAGEDVRDSARAAWFAQRDADDGCTLLAETLHAARRLTDDDAWRKARYAAEHNRLRAARHAATLVAPAAGVALAELWEQPARWLARQEPRPRDAAQGELAVIAMLRLAASDPDAAATLQRTRWQAALPREAASWAWAGIGRQAALRLDGRADDHYSHAFQGLPLAPAEPGWTEDTLAWAVRAALRAGREPRWAGVLRATEAMSPATLADPRDGMAAYWRARALLARAGPASERDPAREVGREGGPEARRESARESERQEARRLLASIASPLTFYGQLAAETLAAPLALPAAPPPPTPAEREAARANPGFARALQLISIGLRSEGVREWNWHLRGLPDRELLAAAQWACEREVWDRCINTSERTKDAIDLAQRYPTPFREAVLATARRVGIDPAVVYGLIRQESRFILDARSVVGASGLMQLMPATARWTAKRIGLDYTGDRINDRDVNLLLGMSYLKIVQEDLGGSLALAAAAYNAGPNRPRRWREGPVMEPAAWAENVPFTETRDYVKKVLANATVYASMLGGTAPQLKPRLGPPIGPREAGAPGSDKEIP